ncbi:hypothetical protein ACFX11_025887 [Malus domestica]
MTETIARVNDYRRNGVHNVGMGSAGFDEAESVGCAQWLRSALCSSPNAVVTPPLQARRLALPRAHHYGHHDQNQRRASLTAVKRLAGFEARRPTLYLKLVTLAASAPLPWLLPLNVIWSACGECSTVRKPTEECSHLQATIHKCMLILASQEWKRKWVVAKE